MTNAELKQQAIELVGDSELSRRFRVWIVGLIKKERIKRENSTPDAFFLNEAQAILDDLNERTGRRYSLTNDAKHLIRGRLNEGYIVKDFCRVHEVKCAKWLSDEKMEANLRPSTLYRPSHFDEYLAEWAGWDRLRTEKEDAKHREEQRKAGQGLDSRLRGNDKSIAEERKANAELIAKLMARSWDCFESWAEFMRWTLQFPDADSQQKYPMPVRIRKMRTAPGMVMKVIGGNSPEWAENEYRALKVGLTTENTESTEKQFNKE